MNQGIHPLVFAAVGAPQEIPPWFEHQAPPEKPVRPPDWMLAFPEGDPDRQIAQALGDIEMPEDASDKLKEWWQAHEKFWEADKAWNRINTIERYYQWRCDFAFNLLGALQTLSAARGPQGPQLTPEQRKELQEKLEKMKTDAEDLQRRVAAGEISPEMADRMENLLRTGAPIAKNNESPAGT